MSSIRSTLRRLVRPVRQVFLRWLHRKDGKGFWPYARQRIALRIRSSQNLSNWYHHAPDSKLSAAVFLHLPRTGGTSLRRALEADSGFVAFEPGQKITSPRLVLDHYKPAALVKRGLLQNQFLNNAFFFSVVRNPETRFLSVLNYYLARGWLEPSVSVNDVLGRLEKEKPRVGLSTVVSLSMFAPQYSWLEALDAPIDRFFRFEDYASIPSALGEQLGEELYVPHINKGVSGGLELTDSERHRVETFYEKDYLIFGYC